MTDSNPIEPKPARAKFDFTTLNTLAVVSLASALSGVASLMAIIALAQLKTSGQSGRTLAIIGLVLGYIGLFFGIILVISGVFTTALVFSDLSGLQPDRWEWNDSHMGFDGFHRDR
jgi:Zn-dependent protease with chaperone function